MRPTTAMRRAFIIGLVAVSGFIVVPAGSASATTVYIAPDLSCYKKVLTVRGGGIRGFSVNCTGPVGKVRTFTVWGWRQNAGTLTSSGMSVHGSESGWVSLPTLSSGTYDWIDVK
ncbi:hypothetical protein ACFFV7_53030 [Nonomuraea spiralis]|uniref:Secreted protein n=1 Tax=Nonomuraea spiralis TaxID=46182 RepID=A0ABV5IZJ1_9ACTN|nr:hypothetical protein [Nonomuraea spiralis]